VEVTVVIRNDPDEYARLACTVCGHQIYVRRDPPYDREYATIHNLTCSGLPVDVVTGEPCAL
jgi:hypothetical protein